MGKMRQTFRALAVVERDPARALAGADAVLRSEHAEIFVTAFVGTYEARTGALRYANAGHPPPFVRTATVRSRGSRRPAFRWAWARSTCCARTDGSLARGDLLVAFTDGLIESDARHRGGRARVAARARASGVRASARSPRRCCARWSCRTIPATTSRS